MTPELFFDRPALVIHKKPQVLNWLEAVESILIQKFQCNLDLAECIYSESEKHNLRLSMRVYSNADDEDKTIILASWHRVSKNRIFEITPETGSNGIIEEISEAKNWYRDKDGSCPSLIYNASIAFGMIDLQKKGITPLAFDPIAMRLLDYATEDQIEEYNTQTDNIISLGDYKKDRSLKHVKNEDFIQKLMVRTPRFNFHEDERLKSSWGIIDMICEKGVFQLYGQSNDYSVRNNALTFRGEITETQKVSCIGEKLDQYIETPLTEGLDLQIEGLKEDSLGRMKFLTDSYKKLFILPMYS